MFEHLKNAVKQAVYYASNQKNKKVGIYIVKSVYIKYIYSDFILLDHL